MPKRVVKTDQVVEDVATDQESEVITDQEVEMTEDEIEVLGDDTETGEEDVSRETSDTEAVKEGRETPIGEFRVPMQVWTGKAAEKAGYNLADAIVTKWRKGVYSAIIVGAKKDGTEPFARKEGDEARNSGKAVSNAIKANGLREADWNVGDALAMERAALPADEGSSDNEKAAQQYFFEIPGEASDRLEAIAVSMENDDADLNRLDRSTRDRVVTFGANYNAAKAVFLEAAPQGEGGLKAWGVWLKKRFPNNGGLREKLSKNFAGQCGRMAKAPLEVLDTIGTSSPSQFEKIVNQTNDTFAGVVAESYAAKLAAANQPLTAEINSTEYMAHALSKHCARLAGNAEAFARYREENKKIAAGKAIPAIAPVHMRDKADNLIMDWLLGDYRSYINEFADKLPAGDNVTSEAIKSAAVPAIEAFGNSIRQAVNDGLISVTEWSESKTGKSCLKAWTNETGKPTPEQVQEKVVTETVAKAKKAFADMSVDEAAAHLWGIFGSHGERGAIINKLVDIFEASEQATSDAKAAASAKAEENPADTAAA